ncbi:phage tail protein [Caproiciproducens sp. NJN-50]|uniref:phage tail sheath N-terminal beta-sandwich domain-containing protein n=1 Tax=Caproiciproducens sp. NJN-50 TaxID=2507162 RepID=UPI000FFE27D7|nr:phage tail sheath N-terminal beta-sandwich domain-containing protein [Caproiciproducens sp. NJN-50]QAT48588.1 phage tail protein [Caproiciproducens sp. NJN-50]
MIQILPGTNVTVQAGERAAELVATGIVAMPFALNWGDTVTEINASDDTLYSLGYKRSDYTGAGMKLVAEVLHSADKLILYRSNTDGGVKATGTVVTGITATAKYVGTLGNDITVTVTASGESWVIKTLVGTTEIDSQIVTDESEFVANDFISVSGTGTLAAASVKLTGGTNGTPRSTEADLWLAEMEKYTFNVIAYCGSTAATITALRAFVADQRAKNNMIQAVMSGVAADNVAIYNNTVGGGPDDYDLSALEACSTIAGLVAEVGITGSLTHHQISWWTKVSPSLTHTQQETAVQSGQLIVALIYGVPTVVYDINSLVTYTDEAPKDFHKGLIMRTLDNYAMNLQKLLDTKCIGKIRNSVEGRAQIKAKVVKLTTENYLNPGYLEDFTADDVTINAGTDSDSVVATANIKVADTVDKIQITVIA